MNAHFRRSWLWTSLAASSWITTGTFGQCSLTALDLKFPFFHLISSPPILCSFCSFSFLKATGNFLTGFHQPELSHRLAPVHYLSGATREGHFLSARQGEGSSIVPLGFAHVIYFPALILKGHELPWRGRLLLTCGGLYCLVTTLGQFLCCFVFSTRATAQVIRRQDLGIGVVLLEWKKIDQYLFNHEITHIIFN